MIRAVAICLAVLAAPVAAQDVTLTRTEARVAALQAIEARQPKVARELALILLSIDAEDRTATTILAGAELALDNYAAARRAARRSLELSSTDAQRYEAQRLLALSAFRDGRPTLAQYWLRRAAINAPDEAEARQTARDYAQIRASNPLAMQLDFSLTPSSNVNGGAESEEFTIEGVPITGALSGEAQALSGLIAEATLNLRHALASSATARTDLSGTLYSRAVRLSDDARDTAPDARNEDFAATVAEVSLFHGRALGPGSANGSLSLGESWFGGERLYSYRRLSAGYLFPLSEKVAGNVQLTREFRDYGDDRIDQVTALRGGLQFALPSGTLRTGLRVSETDSENLQDRADGVSLDLRYAHSEPIGPALLSLSAGLSRTRYPDYAVGFIVVPDGREDRRVSLGIEAFLTDLDYAGFAPAISLTGARTDSNVSRFDRTEFAIGFGLRSTF